MLKDLQGFVYYWLRKCSKFVQRPALRVFQLVPGRIYAMLESQHVFCIPEKISTFCRGQIENFLRLMLISVKGWELVLEEVFEPPDALAEAIPFWPAFCSTDSSFSFQSILHLQLWRPRWGCWSKGLRSICWRECLTLSWIPRSGFSMSVTTPLLICQSWN